MADVNKTIKFTFEPNTSDTIKAVSLVLTSNNYKFESMFYQVNYLNIDRPVMDKNYNFELTDSATTTRDSISFVTYGDWNLEVINPETTDWITLTKNNGSKGTHTVPLELTKNNNSEAARLATLKLTSNGASTQILVKQMAGKKD